MGAYVRRLRNSDPFGLRKLGSFVRGYLGSGAAPPSGSNGLDMSDADNSQYVVVISAI